MPDFFLFYSNSMSQILTVKQDGTGDFTTIQAAVDSAQNGDTVLVWPGTYVENIIATNKNIVLGSLTLTTGDLKYIKQTIINGNHINRCIQFRQVAGFCEVNGFEIKNGNNTTGNFVNGGGISVYGGALDSVINISNCFIHKNNCNGYGGGIYITGIKGHLSNVTITDNQAYDRGGGILVSRSKVTFDTVNRCNIYENYAPLGSDFYCSGNYDTLYFTVDTFTVQNPSYYFAMSIDSFELPKNNIIFNIKHHKIEQVTENLYVSPNGNNNNSGLTPDKPLRTIAYAMLKQIPDSISPDTIFLSNGIYSDSLTGEKFPLGLKKYTNIVGKSKDSTILDAGNTIYHMRNYFTEGNIYLKNFTLRRGNGSDNSYLNTGSVYLRYSNNTTLDSILFTDNKSKNTLCVRTLRTNNIVFKNVDFIKNKCFYHYNGGTVVSINHNTVEKPNYHHDTAWLINCRFINNDLQANSKSTVCALCVSNLYSYGIDTTIHLHAFIIGCLFYDDGYISKKFSIGSNCSEVNVVNCTFPYSINYEFGRDVSSTFFGNINIYNSIFSNEKTRIEIEIDHYLHAPPYDFKISNSLLKKGRESIELVSPDSTMYVIYDTATILEGIDPVYIDTGEFLYNLSPESPCIDKGTLDLPDIILKHMPETDLADNPRVYGQSIDMGAYEWYPVSIKENFNKNYRKKYFSIYPNPNSGQFNIVFKQDVTPKSKIEIYNSEGKHISTYEFEKNNHLTIKLPSNKKGLYFVTLKTDNSVVSTEKFIVR